MSARKLFWMAGNNLEVIACGVSKETVGGTSFPHETIVTLGSTTGTVTLTFDGQSVPDKFEVWFEGVKVIDTGYRGAASYQTNLDTVLADKGLPPETITEPGTGTASFVKSTTVTTALVKVYGPLPSTAWSFTLSCPV